MHEEQHLGRPPVRRTLGDYAVHQGPRNFSRFVIPAEARRVEIKPVFLNLVTSHLFSGKDHEDPYAHLDTFYELCATMGFEEDQKEAAYMKLFPFSLIGEAKEWVKAQPTQSFISWNDFERKFLTKFFPPSKYVSMKTDISTFKQGHDEAFYEAWERFQSLLRKCPNHGIEDVDRLNIFCNGLRPDTKMILDAAAGGTMMDVDVEQATKIINALSSTDRQAQHNRWTVQKKGVFDLNTSNAILAQNEILTQQIELLTKQIKDLPQQLHSINAPSNQPIQAQIPRCELCGGDHASNSCYMQNLNQQEEVQFLNNHQRQGNFSNPFNSYACNIQFMQGRMGNQNTSFNWNQRENPSNRQPPLEQQQYSSANDRLTKLEETMESFIQATLASQMNTEASIRNLENQIGQLAQQLADQHQGQFSTNTQPNPKEQCKSIAIGSGKEIGKGIGDKLQKEEEVLKEKEKTKEAEDEENKKSEKRKEIGKEQDEVQKFQNLPYPKIPSKRDKEKQFACFMNIFKKLQINIPFMESMEHMPTYAQSMKELLKKKKKKIFFAEVKPEQPIHEVTKNQTRLDRKEMKWEWITKFRP